MDETSATQTIRIVVDASAARAGADDVKAALSGVDAATKQLSASMDALTGYLKGIAIGAVTGFLSEMASTALGAAAGLETLSQQLGVNVDFLQASNAAAAEHGVKLDALDEGYAHFSRTIGEALQGNKQAIDLFNSMGVNILDAGGKVRSTEDIFVDYAKSITNIQDPALKAADATGAMGRGGQQLLPVMAELAGGFDNMAARARAMGTVISDEAIDKLKSLEEQSEVTKLKMQATFANAAAGPLTQVTKSAGNLMSALSPPSDGSGGPLGGILGLLGDIGSGTLDAETWFVNFNKALFGNLSAQMSAALPGIQQGIDELAADVQGFVAGVGAAVGGIPELFTAAFTSAMNGILGIVSAGLNKIIGLLNGIPGNSALSRLLGIDSPIPLVPTFQLGGPTVGEALNNIGSSYRTAFDKARADYLAPAYQQRSSRAVQDAAMARMLEENAPAGSGGSVPTSLGVSNPAVKGQGQALQKSLDKMNSDAQVALDQANAAAAAANEGADAVANLEQHYKDLKEVQDAYIKAGYTQQQMETTLKPAIDAEVASLDAKGNATRALNALKTQVIANQDATEQNNELQLQLSLTGQTSNEIQRQAALMQANYKAQKDSLAALADGNTNAAAAAQQALQVQTDQINRQYDLKAAIDATQKSTQQWLQPFSQAISGIQNGFESMFETVFKGGTLTWQTMIDDMKSIWVKFLAEMATTSIMQGIVGPVVQSVFSPSAAQSLGFGGGFSGLGSILSPLFGGSSNAPQNVQLVPNAGGGFTLQPFGGASTFGGGGGFFSNVGSFLNTPFTGDFAGIGPDAMAGVIPGLSGADALNYFGGLSGGLNLTPLGALGGIASIGSGIFQMMSGNGSAGSMIGGAAGILGGGLSLLGPALGLGAAAGPIGLGIGLIGGILGGLLGGGGPSTPPMPALVYGSTGFGYSGGYNLTTTNVQENGGADLTSTARSIAGSVLALITAAGGTLDTSKAYGGGIAEGTNHVLNGNSWQAQNYTQGSITSPSGQTTWLAYNSSQSLQTTAEQVATALFGKDVLTGAVTGAISATLKAVLAGPAAPTTLQDMQTAVTNSQKYDDLVQGDKLTQAQQSFESINNSMASIVGWAQQMGLDIQPLLDAQAQQQQDLVTNFMQPITEGIKAFTDPLGAQIDQITQAEQNAVKEATWMNENISGAFIDMSQVTTYYTDQMTAATQQFYSSAVSSIQQAIDSMTFGSLSGASPLDTFMGAQAKYNADLAGAATGDATSINDLATAASTFLTAGQAYYGNTTQYSDLVDAVRSALADELANIQSGNVSGGSTVSSDAVNSVLTSNSELSSKVDSLTEQVANLIDQNQQLTTQMQRIAAGGR